MSRALAVFTLLLLGCPAPPPGTDAGVDAGTPAVTPVELCERLSAARCEVKSRCYPAFTRLAPADCQTVENSTCLAEYESIRDSFDNALVSIDGAALLACETRMQTSACPPSFPPDYPATVSRPFSDCALQAGLITGTVPSGDTCARGIECAPGTVCVKPNGVCRGTCSTPPIVGETCAFGCARGLICGAGGLCAAPLSVNAPCMSSAECEADLVCEGTCRPRSRLGEACRWDPDRLSTCEPGLACDVAPWVAGLSGTCVRPGALFAACKFHWSCEPGLVCADIQYGGFPQSAPSGGFCRAQDATGGNCNPTAYAAYVGDQCSSGLSCSMADSRCQLLPRLGEACRPSAQDCSGFGVHCKPTGSGDVGTCTGPAGIGDRCAFRIDASRTVGIPCSAGYCDRQTTELCRPAYKATGATCEEDGECLTNRCAVQQDRTLKCAQAC